MCEEGGGGGNGCAPLWLNALLSSRALTPILLLHIPSPCPPQAKDGAGSATLSMAFAADRFVGSLLRALKGETGVSECAFVESPVVPGCAFFATRIELSGKGVEKIHPIGALSAFEKAGLEKALPELKGSIAKGVEFAQAWKPKA